MKNGYSVNLLALALVLFVATSCNSNVDTTDNCDCETLKGINDSATLNSSNTTLVLSTYQADGDFLADASCHASMWIDIIWADSTRAASTEEPPISVSFESVFGYFPSGGPEMRWSENLGVNYWRYIVSEAADRNATEGTDYSITATYNTSYGQPGDVSVAAYIDYRLFDENVHARTDRSSCL